MTDIQERRDLLMREAPSEPIVPGWYVNSDRGEPDYGANFCHRHALIVAAWEGFESGILTWADSSSSGSDRARRCDFGGCEIALDFGGLTDDGIDDALGLIGEDPMSVHVYPAELELAAGSMAFDDPRWETWEAQVKRAVRELRAELAQIDDKIDRLYWTFTRTKRGKPPAVVAPELYARRREIKTLLRIR